MNKYLPKGGFLLRGEGDEIRTVKCSTAIVCTHRYEFSASYSFSDQLGYFMCIVSALVRDTLLILDIKKRMTICGWDYCCCF